MKRRHFKITGGPTLSRVLELNQEGHAVEVKALEMGRQLGGEPKYYQATFDGYRRLAGFRALSDSPTFDPALWRRDHKNGIWTLRSRAQDKGRSQDLAALKQLLEPILQIPEPWLVLEEVQGLGNGPLCLVGRYAHKAGFHMILDFPYPDGNLAPIVFISLPWPAPAKDDDMNDRYRKGVVIPSDWVEVKEWEQMRDLEEAETAREARKAS